MKYKYKDLVVIPKEYAAQLSGLSLKVYPILQILEDANKIITHKSYGKEMFKEFLEKEIEL